MMLMPIQPTNKGFSQYVLKLNPQKAESPTSIWLVISTQYMEK
jgi:serine protease inhibitor ecotin